MKTYFSVIFVILLLSASIFAEEIVEVVQGELPIEEVPKEENPPIEITPPVEETPKEETPPIEVKPPRDEREFRNKFEGKMELEKIQILEDKGIVNPEVSNYECKGSRCSVKIYKEGYINKEVHFDVSGLTSSEIGQKADDAAAQELDMVATGLKRRADRLAEKTGNPVEIFEVKE